VALVLVAAPRRHDGGPLRFGKNPARLRRVLRHVRVTCHDTQGPELAGQDARS